MSQKSAVFAIWLIAWGGGAHAAPRPTDNAQAFQAIIAKEQADLPDIWERDLKAAIIGADPTVDRAKLARLHLTMTGDPCLVAPRFEPQDGTIHVGSGFLFFMAAAQQPAFFYVAGNPAYANTDHIYAYYHDITHRLVEQHEGFCRARDPQLAGQMVLPMAGNYFGESEDEYRRNEQMYASNDEAVRLGDMIGAAIAFFAILHEANHALHEDSAAPPVDAELRADRFAAAVLRAYHAPPSLGVSALLMLEFNGHAPCRNLRECDQEVGCRVRSVLQEEGDLEAMMRYWRFSAFTPRVRTWRAEFLQKTSVECPRLPAR